MSSYPHTECAFKDMLAHYIDYTGTVQSCDDHDQKAYTCNLDPLFF